MELWVNVAKLTFFVSTRKIVFTTLLVIAIFIPVFNSIRFQVVNGYSLLIEVALSLVLALIYYCIAYVFAKLMEIIVTAIYKKPPELFLVPIIILLVPANFLLYWDGLFQSSWVSDKNIFNAQLILLAIYLGLGNFCFLGSYLPSRDLLVTERIKYQQLGETLKSSFFLLVVVSFVFLLSFT